MFLVTKVTVGSGFKYLFICVSDLTRMVLPGCISFLSLIFVHKARRGPQSPGAGMWAICCCWELNLALSASTAVLPAYLCIFPQHCRKDLLITEEFWVFLTVLSWAVTYSSEVNPFMKAGFSANISLKSFIVQWQFQPKFRRDIQSIVLCSTSQKFS